MIPSMYEQISLIGKNYPAAKAVKSTRFQPDDTGELLKARVAKWKFTRPLTSQALLAVLGYAKSTSSLKPLHRMEKLGFIKRAGETKVRNNTAYLWIKTLEE